MVNTLGNVDGKVFHYTRQDKPLIFGDSWLPRRKVKTWKMAHGVDQNEGSVSITTRNNETSDTPGSPTVMAYITVKDFCKEKWRLCGGITGRAGIWANPKIDDGLISTSFFCFSFTITVFCVSPYLLRVSHSWMSRSCKSIPLVVIMKTFAGKVRNKLARNGMWRMIRGSSSGLKEQYPLWPVSQSQALFSKFKI